MEEIYSFVMKGELTKVALDKTKAIGKYSNSEIIVHEYIKSLAIDLLDDEDVQNAQQMATVYMAIAALENSVRRFVVNILIENHGEDWWTKSVSDKIRKKAESRKEEEEEKIKWHSQRGESLINYTEFGDLASIMAQNLELFEDYIISIDWARQIFSTLERSRNVIMHSGFLGPRDIERIGTNIRDWIAQVGD